MAIEFRCPTCGGTLRVDESTAGGAIRCGGCLTVLVVPAASRQSAPAEVEPRQSWFQFADSPEPRRESADDEPRQPHDLDDADRDLVRPRRRRDTDERPKSSMKLFWGIVIGCLVGVAVIGLAVSNVGLFDAKWGTHSSARGGYRVELPGAPRPNFEGQADLPRLVGTTVEGTRHRLTRYAVMWSEIHRRQWQSDEEIIDETIAQLAGDRRLAREDDAKSLTVSGFSAREVELIEFDGESVVIRVIVADTRVYVLVASGPNVEPDDRDVRRFLDSFQVTDPRLPRR